MKTKSLLLAGTLVASVLAFTACNNSNDPQHPLQNVKFYCDYPQRGDLFWQETMFFQTGDAFEYGFIAYSNEAHTKVVEGTKETGTYEIMDDYINLHYQKLYNLSGNSTVENSSYQPRSEKCYYVLKGNTLTLTFNKGAHNEYDCVYYK